MFLIQERDDEVQTYSTSVWGPSCDGIDRIIEHDLMPELDVGEWIVFPGKLRTLDFPISHPV